MQTNAGLYKVIIALLAVLILAMALVIGLIYGRGREPVNPVESSDPSVSESSGSDSSSVPDSSVTEQTPPVTDPPAPAETKRISVIACGDNILYRPNTWEAQERIAQTPGAALSFAFFYTDVAEFIGRADVAFINQESLAAGGNSGYPLFNSPFEIADTLAALGFDVVNMATNHMLDVGFAYGNRYSSGEGIRLARAYMDRKNFLSIGGYLDGSDAETIRILEREGVKIAFLAFTESTNTLTVDPQSGIVIPYLEENFVREQVALAKQKADFVVVSAHWGTDSSDKVTETQKKYAQLFADLGVDVVIGTHPHLLQPIEWIEGKDGGRMLCAYSLGNFLAMMESPEMMLGGFLSFEIVAEEGKAPCVENVGFTPTLYHYNTSYRGSHIYWLDDYTDELASVHGCYSIYGHSFTMKDLRRYLTAQISSDLLLSAPQKEN